MKMLHGNPNEVQIKKDDVIPLPIIDLYPTNITCILSTLSVLANLAHTYSQPAIVAFDQPLFWKGSKIMNQNSDILVKDVILMLGNFHTIMNLLGCIGSLMDGSRSGFYQKFMLKTP